MNGVHMGKITDAVARAAGTRISRPDVIAKSSATGPGMKDAVAKASAMSKPAPKPIMSPPKPHHEAARIRGELRNRPHPTGHSRSK